jgi:competence protein ComEA
MTSTPSRYSLGWRTGGLAALVVLCAVWAVLLGLCSRARPIRAGEAIPVDRRRLEAAAERINPNLAGVGSLVRLRGIGPARAEAIMAYRRAHGPTAFRSAGDLSAVKNIGPVTVRSIAPHLTFRSAPFPATSPTAPPR